MAGRRNMDQENLRKCGRIRNFRQKRHCFTEHILSRKDDGK